MKIYMISLGAGLLIGVIYSLLGVRSPAPPAVALIGLLGMLIGEQALPPIKRIMAGEALTMAWFRTECAPKITGAPPSTSAASVSVAKKKTGDEEKKAQGPDRPS